MVTNPPRKGKRGSIHCFFPSFQTAIHTLISAIATRLGLTALVSRAQMLFDQAMSSGQFRWGRKSRLLAGSAIAIAAREAHRPVTAFDIAVGPFDRSVLCSCVHVDLCYPSIF